MCNFPMDKFDEYLRKMIKFHGFGSNTVGGFSCFMTDPSPFPVNEGTFLWKRSMAFSGIETSIQMFHSMARINRMVELGIPEDKYKEVIMLNIDEYLNGFKAIGINKEIGGGVELFGDRNSIEKNLRIQVKNFDCNALRRLELFTINNSIVKVWEKLRLFKVKNPDKLIIYDYCPELKDVPIDSSSKSSSFDDLL